MINTCRSVGRAITSATFWSLLTGFSVLIANGSAAADPQLEIEPLAARQHSEVDSKPLLELLSTEQTGVDFANPIDTYHPSGDLYHASYACGGIAIGDVDGDGLPDIFLSGTTSGSKLYRNLGDFRFEDVTSAAKVAGGDVWSTGAAMVDIDGDDDLDLYVCNYDAANYLYINDGKGRFTEQAEKFGLATRSASLMAHFCDYDRDGDLDMYLIAYRYYRPDGRPRSVKAVMKDGRPVMAPEFAKYYKLVSDGTTNFANWTYTEIGCLDHLYRNDNGRFTDVSDEAGLIREPAYGNSAVWWDYDNDGWFDLYVGNDFTDADWLYKNNRDGTFTEVIREATPQTTWYSMGSMVGDINNDGRPDLVVADMGSSTHYKSKMMMGDMNRFKDFMDSAEPRQHMRNCVFLATGTPRLLEAGYMAGLAKTDWTWSVRLADFDNDGWLDAFFTNGVVRDFMNSDRKPITGEMLIENSLWLLSANEPPLPEQNFAFRNDGDLHFSDVSGDWGLDFVGMSYAAGLGDLDADGDVDLLVANMDDQVFLYRNLEAQSNRLTVRLQGRGGNTHGIGATVRVETDRRVLVRQNLPHQGFISSDEPQVHFGLHRAEKINRMIVTWADGAVQTHENLPANSRVTVIQAESTAREPSNPPPSPLYVASDSLEHVRHRETPYNDFARQPLLPNKMSQLGPGIAWGDVDGDGDDDFYVGGAAGQPGALYENQGGGQFAKMMTNVFARDEQCEDMGAIFFDVDADGDLDLYVVSGSGEMEADSELLQDRLYLNNGKAGWTSADDDALPAMRESGSSVCGADFDRDGDLDLFVGGRLVPGAYPTSPQNMLLQNDQGKLTDVTDDRATGLRSSGMVTGAVWSDANGDGWVDLLVAHEWGPVKYFENREGKLVDTDANLDAMTGWWNGIDAGDVDNDGDIDYLVTNFGLNTKYKASRKSPCLVYYADFEKTGEKHVVEAGFENDVLLPRRGRSCSSQAMPFLAEKFPTYHEFAVANLPGIYTQQCLEEALELSAVNLKSGVLINDGSAQFDFRPLPRLAQNSPGFGCLLAEIDGDGFLDACIVQNFYHPQRETPRMAGGLGWILKGKGDGAFEPLWPARSGLSVQHDATAVTHADFNGDGWPDLAVAVNDGPIQTFLGNPSGRTPPLKVRLQGLPGNVEAIGARVTVEYDGLPSQTAEVRSGSGYLGQSSRTLTFARHSAHPPTRIEVRWPDGETTEHAPAELDETITLSR